MAEVIEALHHAIDPSAHKAIAGIKVQLPTIVSLAFPHARRENGDEPT